MESQEGCLNLSDYRITNEYIVGGKEGRDLGEH